MLLEQAIHLRSKGKMARAQTLNRGGRQQCTLNQPFRDRLLEVVEVPAMQLGRFMSLDATEDLPRVVPEIRLEDSELSTTAMQLFLPAVVDVDNRRFAVVEERISHRGDGYVLGRRDRRKIEQSSRQRRPIAQVAKHPSKGVERHSEMPAALSGLWASEAERGAITSQATK